MRRRLFLCTAVALRAPLPACSSGGGKNDKTVKITKVSCNPKRELYQAINPAFAAAWKQKAGQGVIFQSSHGGSGRQSRA